MKRKNWKIISARLDFMTYECRTTSPFYRIGAPRPQLRLRRRSRRVKSYGRKDAEEEMQPLVDAWRTANPHIVQFWYALGMQPRR